MLLIRPLRQHDECLVSYLISVSERNGFKHIGKLLHYAGLNWKNDRAPIHQILTGECSAIPLLENLGLPECQSKISHLYQSFKRAIDTPYVLAKYQRVCPECLEELGYCKEQWVLLPIVACSRHKRILVDVNVSTGKKLGWYRQYLNRFDGDDYPIKIARIQPRAGLIQQCLHVEALLSGKRSVSSCPVVLMGLEFREMLSMMHFIAHYQMRLLGGSFNPASLQCYELAHVYENVWKTLQAWPDSFYSMLSQYVARPMSTNGQAGLNKHFRDLYERLHRQKENQGIARIKLEFDRYIEEYWPGVLEPERITRIQLVSASRNVISKKDAAHILGSRLERIDKLVQQGRITQVVFKGKAHYLREELHVLAEEMSANWTLAEACTALELTRYQLKQVLDAGVIPVLQKPDCLNRDWIIDKQEALSLISALRSNACKAESTSGAISMAGMQRQGYSLVQLIAGMQSGELDYEIDADVVNSSSFKQFVSFKISKSEKSSR